MYNHNVQLSSLQLALTAPACYSCKKLIEAQLYFHLLHVQVLSVPRHTCHAVRAATVRCFERPCDQDEMPAADKAGCESCIKPSACAAAAWGTSGRLPMQQAPAAVAVE